MPQADANGIRLEYDTFGSPDADPMLLIMGLGAQMILWDESFCEELASRGFYVIRFDNRDIGLSTRFDDAGVPDIVGMMTASFTGAPLPEEPPYTIEDMADDAVGLLDALGIDKAHIFGASMGGMIAQTVAFRHPHRTKTLISSMSSTGEAHVSQPDPEVAMVHVQPTPDDLDGYVDACVTRSKLLTGDGFPFDEAFIRARSKRVHARGLNPAGQTRQLAAIFAQGSRRAALETLDVPTLVMHGTADRLIPVAAGKATAEAIPNAELLLVEGMGHDSPRETWDDAFDAIVRLTQKAQEKEVTLPLSWRSAFWPRTMEVFSGWTQRASAMFSSLRQ